MEIAIASVAFALAFAVAGIVVGGGWERLRDQAGQLILLAIGALLAAYLGMATADGNPAAAVALIVLSLLVGVLAWLERRRNPRLAMVIGMAAVATALLLVLLVAMR